MEQITPQFPLTMKNPLRLALLLAVVLCLGACGRPKPDAHRAANEFFLNIGKSRFPEAYESTTFAFRAGTSFRNFQATAKELGLSAGTVSCNWSKDEPQDSEVKLTGEVRSAAGKTVPIIVRLTLERGEWRVFSLRTPDRSGKKEIDQFSLVGKGDAFNTAASHEIPSLETIQKLTRDSLLLFNDAIQRQDFANFYSKVSQEWQDQLTLGQLQRAFQPFIDNKVDIHDIENLPPFFDKAPQVQSDGILIVEGHYPSKPLAAFFRLRFSYNFPYWKLFGVELQVRD